MGQIILVMLGTVVMMIMIVMIVVGMMMVVPWYCGSAVNDIW